MQGVTLWLLVGVIVWDVTSCTIPCPDGSFCPDGTTCCWNDHGYQCCPYPNAMCCSDQMHCCPAGYHCNLVTKTCTSKSHPWIKVPMVEKGPAEPSRPVVPVSSPVSQDLKRDQTSVTALTEASDGHHEAGVIRCDSKFYCSSGTTCCKNLAGGWSCCPYPLGTCCADGVHCCEYGYTCDPSSVTCRGWYLQVPSGTQQQAKTD